MNVRSSSTGIDRHSPRATGVELERFTCMLARWRRLFFAAAPIDFPRRPMLVWWLPPVPAVRCTLLARPARIDSKPSATTAPVFNALKLGTESVQIASDLQDASSLNRGPVFSARAGAVGCLRACSAAPDDSLIDAQTYRLDACADGANRPRPAGTGSAARRRRAPSREEVHAINDDELRGRRGVRSSETAKVTFTSKNAEDGRVQPAVLVCGLRLSTPPRTRDRPHRARRLERFRRLVELASVVQAVSPAKNSGPEAYYTRSRKKRNQ